MVANTNNSDLKMVCSLFYKDTVVDLLLSTLYLNIPSYDVILIMQTNFSELKSDHIQIIV